MKEIDRLTRLERGAHELNARTTKTPATEIRTIIHREDQVSSQNEIIQYNQLETHVGDDST